jgi:hypothetical protein
VNVEIAVKLSMKCPAGLGDLLRSPTFASSRPRHQHFPLRHTLGLRTHQSYHPMRLLTQAYVTLLFCTPYADLQDAIPESRRRTVPSARVLDDPSLVQARTPAVAISGQPLTHIRPKDRQFDIRALP